MMDRLMMCIEMDGWMMDNGWMDYVMKDYWMLDPLDWRF